MWRGTLAQCCFLLHVDGTENWMKWVVSSKFGWKVKMALYIVGLCTTHAHLRIICTCVWIHAKLVQSTFRWFWTCFYYIVHSWVSHGVSSCLLVSCCWMVSQEISWCLLVSCCWMVSCEVSWCLTVSREISWCLVRFHSVSWGFTVSREASRCLMRFHEVSQCLLVSHEVSRCLMMSREVSEFFLIVSFCLLMSLSVSWHRLM